MLKINQVEDCKVDHTDLAYLANAVKVLRKRLDKVEQGGLAIALLHANDQSSYTVADIKTLRANQVNPRNIMKLALQAKVKAMAIGVRRDLKALTPTNSDINLTLSLLHISNVLEIEVVDYILTNDHDYYSFNAEGLLHKLIEPNVLNI